MSPSRVLALTCLRTSASSRIFRTWTRTTFSQRMQGLEIKKYRYTEQWRQRARHRGQGSARRDRPGRGGRSSRSTWRLTANLRACDRAPSHMENFVQVNKQAIAIDLVAAMQAQHKRFRVARNTPTLRVVSVVRDIGGCRQLRWRAAGGRQRQSVSLRSGDGSAGGSGSVLVSSGGASGGCTGSVRVAVGQSAGGGGGALRVVAGGSADGAGGDAVFSSGVGASSGQVSVGSAGVTTGDGGNVALFSGSAASSSGSVFVQSGAASTGSSGL